MSRVERFVHAAADVGECPVWLDDRAQLLWVDMTRGELHLSGFPTGSTTTSRPVPFLGAAAPRHDGGWVVGTMSGFALIDDDGCISETIDLLPAGQRMNDGSCDPMGRFWSGSTDVDFAAGGGAVHVLAPDRTVTTVITGMSLPNGMDWSPTGDTFYIADSVTHQLLAYDCDLASATVSDPRVLHTFADAAGMPDGLCTDAAGDLWVALWGGSAVTRISPRGERLETIDIPAARTSSCAFGGPALSVLFVTSAAGGLELRDGRDDGSVFTVSGTGARGRTATPFAG